MLKFSMLIKTTKVQLSIILTQALTVHNFVYMARPGLFKVVANFAKVSSWFLSFFFSDPTTLLYIYVPASLILVPN